MRINTCFNFEGKTDCYCRKTQSIRLKNMSIFENYYSKMIVFTHFLLICTQHLIKILDLLRINLNYYDRLTRWVQLFFQG